MWSFCSHFLLLPCTMTKLQSLICPCNYQRHTSTSILQLKGSRYVAPKLCQQFLSNLFLNSIPSFQTLPEVQFSYLTCFLHFLTFCHFIILLCFQRFICSTLLNIINHAQQEFLVMLLKIKYYAHYIKNKLRNFMKNGVEY